VSASIPVLPGDEPLPGEQQAIAVIRRFVTGRVRDFYASSRPALRGQHAKCHGTVEAEFTVADDLPRALRRGLFAQPGRYAAYVRFSASSAPPRTDARRDARGMAIKVLRVRGERLDDKRRKGDQDLILVNHDVFFCRDAVDYAAFATALEQAPPGALGSALRTTEFFFPPDPREWRTREFANLLRVRFKRPGNPLLTRYWSQTPYALGPRAVKYSAVPRPTTASPARAPREYDSLLQAVGSELARRDAVFDFMVQLQADQRTMPVEDPTVPWSEADSPFLRVATIRIPAQDVLSQAARNFGEELRFSPWNSLAVHRPLGSVNRARRDVYAAGYALRRRMNGYAGSAKTRTPSAS